MRAGFPVAAVALLMVTGLTVDARAQRIAEGAQSTGVRESRRTIATAIGVGCGFGLGLYVGLRAFDDAINSDQKVWTTAVIGAAAGGVVGYLVSRDRHIGTTPMALPTATRLLRTGPAGGEIASCTADMRLQSSGQPPIRASLSARAAAYASRCAAETAPMQGGSNGAHTR